MTKNGNTLRRNRVHLLNGGSNSVKIEPELNYDKELDTNPEVTEDNDSVD